MSTRAIGRRIAVAAAVIAMLLGVLVAPAGATRPPGRGKPQPPSTALSTAAYLQPAVTWECWWDWLYWCMHWPSAQSPGWHVRSQLTSSGTPVEGATISAVAESGVELCSGVTNPEGWATCFVPYASGLAASPRGSYHAVFAGDGVLPGARASGTMYRW